MYENGGHKRLKKAEKSYNYEKFTTCRELLCANGGHKTAKKLSEKKL